MKERKENLCPCCNQPINMDILPVKGLREIQVAGRKRDLLEKLVKDYPNRTSKDLLVDTLYGDQEDGGPDDIIGNINQHIFHLRKMIKQYGWEINNSGGNGSRNGDLGSYKLEPIA